MNQPIAFIWRDGTRYRCPFCEWDNAEAANVAEHIANRHRDKTPKPAPVVEEPKATKRKPAAVEPEPIEGTFAALETGE